MSMLAEIRCPLVLGVPNQNHRRTDSHNDEQIILCSLAGSHKFKPKSQYNVLKSKTARYSSVLRLATPVLCPLMLPVSL